MKRGGNITTVLSNLLAVLSVQNSLAAFVHLQFCDLDIASRDSTEDFLLIGFLQFAALSLNVDYVFLTIHFDNFTFATFSFTT